MRIIHNRGIRSGYFNDFDKLAADVDKLDIDKETKGIYVTINPVNPVLLSRRNNRIDKAVKTTSENEILKRVWLEIDIDPIRPPEISSLNEEHDKAIKCAFELEQRLKDDFGFPDAVIGDSGNGAHDNYRIDLPNTPEAKDLIDRCQKAIIQLYNDESKGVDIQGFADANRIWKLYGTTARKGDNTPERPHRRSKLLKVPENIVTLSEEQLKRLAAAYVDEEEPSEDFNTAKSKNKFDVEKFIKTNNIVVKRTKKESNRIVYVLESCVFDPNHTGSKEASIIQFIDGKLGYKCHHNSCKGKHWSDVREKLEPNYKDKWQKKQSLEGNTCGNCVFAPKGGAGSCRNPENEDKEKKKKKQVVYDDAACDKFKVKNTIIKTSNNYAGAYSQNIPIENIDNTPISIDELTTEFKTSVYVNEDINIKLPFCFTVSSFTPVDPDILVIVGASGSGKTEEIRALGDTENQFIYPISSMTSHTFVSGLKDAPDLAPILKNRLITIKDFTTILSKNRDEVSGIFADMRDIMDGYITKTYGSGVGKKEYRGLHSSFLIACTNAIEGYYSLCSVLGQRLIYFRPLNDPRESRKQALKNAGNEKAIREKHHALTMRFLNTILSTQKERLQKITQAVPEDMKERIGKLCDFLAIARTHINRNIKGDMACLPEPEVPTRLTKTLVKLVDTHSIVHNRLPEYQDEAIALRLIHDNLPTERIAILKAMVEFNEPKKTSEIATAAKTPTAMTNRVLNDLAALDIITRHDKESLKSNADSWEFKEGDFKNAFLIVINPKIWSLVTGKLKGVNRHGLHVIFNDEPISYVHDFFIKEKKDIKKEYVEKVINIICAYLTESHPSSCQEGNIEKCGLYDQSLEGSDCVQGPAGLGVACSDRDAGTEDQPEQKGTPQITQLSLDLEKARYQWEAQHGVIYPTSPASIVGFSIWFCQTFNPVYTELDGTQTPLESSAIKGIAERIFKPTPDKPAHRSQYKDCDGYECGICEDTLEGSAYEPGRAGEGMIHLSCKKSRVVKDLLEEFRSRYEGIKPKDATNMKSELQANLKAEAWKLGVIVTDEEAQKYLTNAFNEWRGSQGSNIPISEPYEPELSISGIENAGKEWQESHGQISRSNLYGFLEWYCREKDKSRQPSEVKEIAERIFKLTPDKPAHLSYLCKQNRHKDCGGHGCDCDCHTVGMT